MSATIPRGAAAISGALQELLFRHPNTLPAAAAVGTVAGYFAVLRLRLLPVQVMRAWFIITSVCTVMSASAGVYLIDLLRYLGLPRRHTQSCSVVWMVLAFRVVAMLNPQIRRRVTFDKASLPNGWADLPNSHCGLVLNHTSFWDIFEMLQVLPLRQLVHVRLLFMSSLMKVPLFGGMLRRVGHFPVFFKSNEDGKFTVDKDRQAEVGEHIDEHIHHGGVLAVFPEGAITKVPGQILPFRYGTFATFFKHEVPIYYFLSVGNDQTWPRRASFGGYPANIHIRLGAYPVDYRTKDSKEVSEEMREYLQSVLDQMWAEEHRPKIPA